MLKLQHCNNPSSILPTTSHIKLLLKLSAWGKEALHYPPRSLPPTPRNRRNRGEIMLEKNTRKKKTNMELSPKSCFPCVAGASWINLLYMQK